MRLMRTHLDIDDALLQEVIALGAFPTKRAAVTKALQEFIAKREQKNLLELFGALEWDDAVDCKRERTRS